VAFHPFPALTGFDSVNGVWVGFLQCAWVFAGGVVDHDGFSWLVASDVLSIT
jgi:hypothetical protein